MGRRPLNNKRTTLALPPETMDRIDALVGEKGRALFVRRAVEMLLDAVDYGIELEAKARSRGL